MLCWNSKHLQPNTLTSLHLCIDGFSYRYQLMPSAGMFVPIILFSQPHDIILWLSIDFSTIIPLWSLTMQLLFSIPFIYYYVHFLRHCTTLKCNIWGELLYIQWYSVLHHIDYVHVAIYLQILLCLFCVSPTCCWWDMTLKDDSGGHWWIGIDMIHLLSGLLSNGSESSTSVSGIISLRADMMLPLSTSSGSEDLLCQQICRLP